MQTSIQRRFANGFTFQLNHTWSKMMEATGYLNAGDAFLEQVISDLDRTHRWTLSTIYELPFGKGRPLLANANSVVDAIAGGWQLQAVWQRNTGAPIGFGNVLLTGDISDLSSGQQTLDQWFNTSIFNRVPAQQLASNYRTVSTRFGGVRLPSQETWDISAVKNFKLRETTTLQLRGEFLNAMNVRI